MKKVLVLFVAITMLIFSCGEKNELKQKRVPSVDIMVNEVAMEGDKTNHFASIEIDGMTCAMGCAKMIENKLKAMDGVVSVEVDFENTLASVEFDQSKTKTENFLTEIASIHDGQYVVTKATLNKPVQIEVAAEESNEENSSSSADEGSVEQIVINYPSIHIPNLVDVLLKLLPY